MEVILVLVYLAFLVGLIIWAFSLATRLVEAHEKLARSVEKLADGDDPPPVTLDDLRLRKQKKPRPDTGPENK